MFEWMLSVVTSAGLIAAVLWLSRNLLLTRLKASVEHEFNQKLELFRAELKRGQGELDAIRGAVLGALASSNAAAGKRRIDAIDQILRSLAAMKTGVWAVQTLSILKVDVFYARIREQKIQQFLEITCKPVDGLPEKLREAGEANLARPYVSEWAWALFSAYGSVIGHEVIRMVALRHGQDPNGFADTAKVLDLLAVALPHRAQWIEEKGVATFPYLLDEIESALIRELRMGATGERDDASLAERATEVIRRTNELSAKLDGAEISMREAAALA